MKIPFLKFIHSGLLTGMPSLLYNPYTKLSLNVPLTISPNSLYINFKLTDKESSYINEYIKEQSSLELVPISLFPNEKARNYLSVNIYNCTSPVFLNDNVSTTRCEINTYVKDRDGNYGTVILDYLSNGLSMDPVNIFKQKDKTNYLKKDKNNFVINCESSGSDNIFLNLQFCNINATLFKLNDQLTKYSDFIYYKNGIYDKLYYDNTLVDAVTLAPFYYEDFEFNYIDLSFNNFDSMFYFNESIKFVGSMWNNLYKL
tara:strand:+ start:6071 stop:6844 length:774 start_codon:yes stop_codon:yes gene_type:complete